MMIVCKIMCLGGTYTNIGVRPPGLAEDTRENCVSFLPRANV
jgi:hypothetical protein